MLILEARGAFRRTYTVVDDGPDGRSGRLSPSLARPAVWDGAGPDLQIEAGTVAASWSVVDGRALATAHPDRGATSWTIDGEGAGLRLAFGDRGVMEVQRDDARVGTARALGALNRRLEVNFAIDTALAVRLLLGYIAVRYLSAGYGDH